MENGEKIQIYLPKEMKLALIQDSIDFEINRTTATKPNLNGLLNMILSNYTEQYTCERAEQISAITRLVKDGPVKGKENDISELSANILRYIECNPSDRSSDNTRITLTVNQNTSYIIDKMLYSKDAFSHFAGSTSETLRSFFAFYLSKPKYIREEILFADAFKKLRVAKQKRKYVSFSSISNGKRIFFENQRICDIMADQNEKFNYLICMEKDSSVPRSFRISRIPEGSIDLSDQKFSISPAEENALKEVRKYGPLYASPDIITAKVAFTPEGIDKYNRIYTNRPPYMEAVENVYTFIWPQFHLAEYLKRFGPEAEVLSPESLRKELRTFYTAAAKKYK